MRNTAARVRQPEAEELTWFPATRGDDWIECCLDEGVVVRWRAAPAGEVAPDDDVTWLVPERDGRGYAAMVVGRDCDLIGIVGLDD